MKLSWPKTLVKKWLNIKSKAEEFHADDIFFEGDFLFFFSFSIKLSKKSNTNNNEGSELTNFQLPRIKIYAT